VGLHVKHYEQKKTNYSIISTLVEIGVLLAGAKVTIVNHKNANAKRIISSASNIAIIVTINTCPSTLY
jgi:hypothetical protein